MLDITKRHCRMLFVALLSSNHHIEVRQQLLQRHVPHSQCFLWNQLLDHMRLSVWRIPGVRN
jgi:hypothetical protein